MTLYCQTEGCPATIEVNESVSPAVKYVCREHTGRKENDVRFQDSQFDPKIGAGTDPKAYERGQGFFGKGRRSEINRTTGRPESSRPTGSVKRYSENVIAKAAEELAVHENRDEILKVLREDIRDGNSGANRDE